MPWELHYFTVLKSARTAAELQNSMESSEYINIKALGLKEAKAEASAIMAEAEAGAEKEERRVSGATLSHPTKIRRRQFVIFLLSGKKDKREWKRGRPVPYTPQT